MQPSTEMEMKAQPITAGFIFIFNKIDLDQFEITAGARTALLLDTSFVFVSDLGSKGRLPVFFQWHKAVSEELK